MQKANLYWDATLGIYDPSEGDLSAGFVADCNFLGALLDLSGQPDAFVYEGEKFVVLLILDGGYGKSDIRICDKSVLEEIKSRLVG